MVDDYSCVRTRVEEASPTESRFYRKRIALLVIFGLAALPLFFFFFPGSKKNQSLSGIQEKKNNGNGDKKPDIGDTDGDGLLNWEEALFKTDPLNPDSDGDGMSDGEEVLKGRHPLKAGEQERIADQRLSIPGDVNATAYSKLILAGEGNLTQTFLQKVLRANLGTFLKTGNKGAFEDIKIYITALKENFPEYNETAVSDSRLIIADANDHPAIRNYFNAVAGVYEKRLSRLQEKDIQAASDAFTEKDSLPLEELADYELAVMNAVGDIEKIPAPRDILPFHKKEIWFLERTREEVSLLSRASLDDPLYVLFLLEERVNRKSQMVEFHLTEIPKWLAERNISFTPSDKARLLYTSATN